MPKFLENKEHAEENIYIVISCVSILLSPVRHRSDDVCIIIVIVLTEFGDSQLYRDIWHLRDFWRRRRFCSFWNTKDNDNLQSQSSAKTRKVTDLMHKQTFASLINAQQCDDV